MRHLQQLSQKALFLLLLGFLIRILLTNAFPSRDIEGYMLWANYLQSHGIADVFEFLPGGYPPYPPAYYYVLKSLGFLISLFSLWENTPLVRFIISLPVYVSDMLIACLIYLISKRTQSEKKSLINLSFYYFNPAIIFTSVFLGQVDSLLILLGLGSLLLLVESKLAAGLFLYTIALLTKPQAFALLPAVLVLLYKNRSKSKLVHVLPSAVTVFAVFFPVVLGKGFQWTVSYFLALPHWYPYTSVYAYNLWSLAGFMVPDKTLLVGIPMRFWGLLLFGLSALLIMKKLEKVELTIKNMLFSGFLLFFFFALFSTRIHSRYFIYTVGFFAPFASEYVAFSLLISFFVFANLLLTGEVEVLKPIALLLTQPTTVRLFVIGGLALGILFWKKYKKI